MDAFLWLFYGHVQVFVGFEADPELAGGIAYPIWPGNALGSSRRSWRMSLRKGTSGILCCHCNPTGWMVGWFLSN